MSVQHAVQCQTGRFQGIFFDQTCSTDIFPWEIKSIKQGNFVTTHDFSVVLLPFFRISMKVLFLFAVLTAGGCSGGEGLGGNQKNSQAILSVTPSEMSECGPETSIAKISWNTGRPSNPRVRIEVGHVGSEQSRIFFIGNGKSSSYTEQWVRIGTVFIMSDDESGDFLKSHEVTAVPCL